MQSTYESFFTYSVSAYALRYNSKPPTLHSFSNRITVRFSSHIFGTGRGILMAYVLGYYFSINSFLFITIISRSTEMNTKLQTTVIFLHLIFPEQDECQISHCNNGATCVDEVDGYMCQCTDQWLGKNCTGIYVQMLKLTYTTTYACVSCCSGVTVPVIAKVKLIFSLSTQPPDLI